MAPSPPALSTLETSIAVLQRALSATSDGVVVTDPHAPDNPIVYVNPAFERLTGYTSDEVLGRNCRLLQGPGTDRRACARLRQDLAHPREVRATLLNYRKDGSTFWNDLSVSPVYEGGTLKYFIGVQTDVTDRERVGRRTEEAREFAETVYETVRESLLVLDTSLRVVRANRNFYRTFQVAPEDTEGRSLYDLGDRQWNIPALRVLLEQILPTRNPFDDFVVEHAFPDIGHKTMLLNARRLDREGEPHYILLAIEDITQRTEQVAALRESERRYETLVEGLTDHAVIRLDTGGAVVSWSRGATHLLGWEEHEVRGRFFAFLFPQAERETGAAHNEIAIAAAEGRADDSRWIVRKDGSQFWASGVTSALYDDAGCLLGFAKLMRDATERRRFEERLWQRAEDLSSRDRAKDEFLAMLSHELRNPLAALSNALHLVRHHARDMDVLRRPVEIADRQVAQMSRLVNDLLDVARIMRGKITLQKTEVDLGQIATVAARSLASTAQAKGLVFEVDVDGATHVHADALRLEQVLHNVLSNAIKFTEAGRVQLAVRTETRHAVVEVKDTGCGIAPELLPHVFELFRQGDRPLARTQGGLGIGLTVVKQLMDLHGGAIDVHSEGTGHGTTVSIRLPLDASRTRVVRPRASPQSMPRKTLRALIVEDNVDGADALSALLDLYNYESHVVHDGVAALEAALRLVPDVVLLDIGLPGRNGYEVAREIRTRPELAGIRLIALTGYGQPEDTRRAMEAGFDYHLLKPVDLETLESVLRRVGTQRAAREAEAGMHRSSAAPERGGAAQTQDADESESS